MRKELTVLLSTYNGERYLDEQIESVLRQDIGERLGIAVRIVARDDGSTDGTCGILESYRKKGKLEWTAGENIGAANSFWKLLESAPKSEYYAFCDQDDVWFADKLTRAVRRLRREKNEIPLVYGSAVLPTDASLNPVKAGMGRKAVTDFGRLLIYSGAPGCTLVWNRRAQEEFAAYCRVRCEETGAWHDWTVQKIAAMLGKVVYDKEPSLYYRQHGRNTLGWQTNGFMGTVARIRRFITISFRCRSHEAEALWNAYEDGISEEGREKKCLKEVAFYRKKAALWLSFFMDKDFRIHSMDDFFLKCLIVLRII